MCGIIKNTHVVYLPSLAQILIARSPPHDASKVPDGLHATHQQRASGCALTLCSSSSAPFISDTFFFFVGVYWRLATFFTHLYDIRDYMICKSPVIYTVFSQMSQLRDLCLSAASNFLLCASAVSC